MAENEIKKERFEILVEELKKDFRAAFDGIITLRDETRRGFEGVKEQVKLVDGKVTFVANKVNKIDQKLEEHMRLPAHS